MNLHAEDLFGKHIRATLFEFTSTQPIDRSIEGLRKAEVAAPIVGRKGLPSWRRPVGASLLLVVMASNLAAMRFAPFVAMPDSFRGDLFGVLPASHRPPRAPDQDQPGSENGET